MNGLDVGRCIMAAATAILCGCGVSSPAVTGGAPFQSHAGPLEAQRHGEWMLGEAKNETLIYVSAAPNEVFIYSYPRPKLVGELHFDAVDVEGICSDKDGNVWVPIFDQSTSQGKILEYAHGRKRRLAMLSDDGYPSGCAVEPETGDLAVSNFCMNYRGTTCVDSGDVLVYSGARGIGMAYQDPSINNYGFCTYDDSGDLFVDGTDFTGNFKLAELRRGQAGLENVAIDQTLTLPAGVQWQGKHLAIASASTIYEFSIKHASATEVGSSPLNDTTGASQFALQGKIAIVPGEQSNNVASYRYPTGGSPVIDILLFRAISAALSLPAPSSHRPRSPSNATTQ